MRKVLRVVLADDQAKVIPFRTFRIPIATPRCRAKAAEGPERSGSLSFPRSSEPWRSVRPPHRPVRSQTLTGAARTVPTRVSAARRHLEPACDAP